MGMFDSLYVDCPHCGKPVEFQSKEWNCDMSVYSLHTAPTAILRDVMNWPNHCEKCDGWFALIDSDFPPGPPPRPVLRSAKVTSPENPQTHSQGMKWWPDEKGFSYDDLAPPTETGRAPMTQEFTLRAMAKNYAGGHSWDHLDGEACINAADEIARLREALRLAKSDMMTVVRHVEREITYVPAPPVRQGQRETGEME